VGVKWLALLACLVLTASAVARTDTPPDESDPELVKKYLFFPCDALEDSYDFLYNELTHMTERLVKCHKLYDGDNYKYGKLMCLYVKMQWEYTFTNLKSVEKAYHLMCDEIGRKNPEYEIDF
jgi:hypothetical protein